MCSIISCAKPGARDIDLILIPPRSVSNQVDLDIRAGIISDCRHDADYVITLSLLSAEGTTTLASHKEHIAAGSSFLFRHTLPTADLKGYYEVVLEVRRGLWSKKVETRPIEVIPYGKRSLETIDGAWAGICHWSEQEGKHWNDAIRKLTAEDWKGVVRSMHHCGMDIIVVQELFRKDAFYGQHDMTVDSYDGRAYYPSALYAGRMDVACEDPLEAIMEEADRLEMSVLPGIGLYAWFDYSPESLEWHKRVTKEVLQRYGHHRSFYGFYVSEEALGSLEHTCETPEERQRYTDEIIRFYEEYTAFCRGIAPAKPVMLASNCYGLDGKDEAYAALLKHLDILCPFAFGRIPEEDLSAEEAAGRLQKWCDAAGTHLWMDLEAFLFNSDGSLRPRPIEEILGELTRFGNFEKTLCYQFPGVFSNPSLYPQVGEDASVTLYQQYVGYRWYMDWQKPYSILPRNKIVDDPKGIFREDSARRDCIEVVVDAKDDPRIQGRTWQGVPDITATPDGRVIYASWYGGGVSEEMGNYLTVSISDDGGASWHHDEVALLPKDPKTTRIFDPVLWCDPSGNVHMSCQVTISDEAAPIDTHTSLHEMTLRWDGGKLHCSKPEFMTYGMMKNAPVFLPSGEGLFPIYRCSQNQHSKPIYKENPTRGTFVYVKKGNKYRQYATLPPVDPSLYEYEEHQFATLDSDGKELMCVARFRGGLRKSFSHDYGRTWSEFEPMPEIGESTASRPHLIRLQSGRLLLLYNNSPVRANMTAALSDDNGQTWPHKLLIDERINTSYPGACQLQDGTILMIYDRDRYGDMDILFTKLTEEDILTQHVPQINRITD